ncbi:hypothetical protein MNQ96_04545 [Sphingopyxis granuli]|uniref:hypothetical protein n=1 Tax=Sphingopyxis granuli TaxID=267128 RepID=UPI001F52F02E|nr:hypothetical protein [Sphingopyxis granuli]UNK80353.1 hypothetical protein MNQ96_04545 [Sphingopyxis granuli]
MAEVPIEDLKTLSGHPWAFKDKDIERAMPFVSRYQGRALPVMADDDDHILASAIFIEAARRLGIKAVKVIRQSGISEAEALLFGTAITKIQSLGSWDGAAMEKALRQLEDYIAGFSAGLIGFAPGEFDRLIGADIFDGGGNSLPRVEEKAVSWLGATWICGDHRVLCGDATCPDTVAALLAGETISVAICDPPFGCKVDGFVSRKGRHEEVARLRDEPVELNRKRMTKYELALTHTINQTIRSGKPRDLKLLMEILDKYGVLPEVEAAEAARANTEAVYNKIMNLFNHEFEIDPADTAELERLSEEESKLIMSCSHCGPALREQWSRPERQKLTKDYGRPLSTSRWRTPSRSPIRGVSRRRRGNCGNDGSGAPPSLAARLYRFSAIPQAAAALAATCGIPLRWNSASCVCRPDRRTTKVRAVASRDSSFKAFLFLNSSAAVKSCRCPRGCPRSCHCRSATSPWSYTGPSCSARRSSRSRPSSHRRRGCPNCSARRVRLAWDIQEYSPVRCWTRARR